MVIGQSPSTCFQRAASTALCVSAVAAKVRSSPVCGLLEDGAPGRRGVVFHPNGQPRGVGRVSTGIGSW